MGPKDQEGMQKKLPPGKVMINRVGYSPGGCVLCLGDADSVFAGS